MLNKFRKMLWPYLLALPPLAAVLAGMVTVYLMAKHPDQEIRVAPTETQSTGETRHVTNSVVPPLR